MVHVSTFDRPFFALACLLLAGCARPPGPGEPIRGLTPEQLRNFEVGRDVFARTFEVADGLGPLFNAESCAECHEDPVNGGAGDEVEVHAARAPLVGGTQLAQVSPREGCDLLFTLGGPVYQLQTTPALREALGIDNEPIPPGATIARRSSPDVFGFGLLDAIPDSTILALADPDDANGDGISGRPNRFLDGRLGRFGRKAFVPTLAEFNAGAFQIEMGITVAEAPDEGTVGGEPIPPGVDPTPDPELEAESVQAANAYVRFLAPPARRASNDRVARGARVFARIGCNACHVPELRTGASDVRALANRKVAAYTDLLLHDMGPELADICFGEATPSEFRTEPLMGLRFSTTFLHDGRATSVDEAIRQHGGEAVRARDAFVGLPELDQRLLLAFLATL